MLTPAELAVELRVSVRQVQRFAAAGLPYIPVGARKQYDLAACVAWLKANERPSRREAERAERIRVALEKAFPPGSVPTPR